MSGKRNKGLNDICVNVPENEKKMCKICGDIFDSTNALAGHVGAKHRILFSDYLIKFYLKGITPQCPICGATTRYVRGKQAFKKYCKNHVNEARTSWSKENGFGTKQNAGWKKGLDKYQHPGIMSQSLKKRISEEEYYKRVNSRKDEFEVTEKYEQYVDKTYQKLHIKCLKCGREQTKTLADYCLGTGCYHCRPKSKQEEEVAAFVESLGFTPQRQTRTVIPPYELDIYIPEKNFAVEYHGLFWHTIDKVPKNLHNEKALACIEKNIELLQIFSDEWETKKDICKSMIEHRLGIVKNRVFARKCKVVEMNGNESRLFFNESHLAGGTRAQIHFGLKYENKIIAGLSLRAPIQKSKDKHLREGITEIARFATLPYYHISGGFGKLFKAAKQWAKERGYKKILTYADLRCGHGNLYFKNGFTFKGQTASCMYWYTKVNEGTNPEKANTIEEGKRFFRFRYRACKPLTEKQVAEEFGVEKIFGTVNNTFEMIL